MENEKISLITTVLNEEASIGAFLECLQKQSRPPDEIIIVDGGSTDNTVIIILSFRGLPIRCYVEPCNIARGRNIAIDKASNPIIAVTDGGCRPDSSWLERLIQFDKYTDVSVGNYSPVVNNLFDACQYSLMGLFRSGKSLESFTISSRSLAFRKRVWQEIGGYPEWLNFSEDQFFHRMFSKQGHRVRFTPDAVVRWEQRSSARQVFRQFFLYMQGEAQGGLHLGRNLLRFGFYACSGFLLALSWYYPSALAALALGALAYLSSPVRSFLRLGAFPLSVRALAMISGLVLVMDAGKICGYMDGCKTRFQDAIHHRTDAVAS